jgi:RNA-directed DNA polymerase
MKPYSISKEVVREAYRKVKSNQGTAGVDFQTIEKFEEDLEKNLYKIWNRMSSGTYFPPPVRTVAIPKDNGSMRLLGIPTIADRIAQTIAKMYLEPLVEPCFHPDSYGYRPNKSALDAVATTRERCWRYDWVVELDIKSFFDNLDHELVMQAVKKYTEERWLLLYIERWLKAPSQLKDGTLVNRNKGTPQGGVISPLLANIFLHQAFDSWMATKFPTVPFERYADDVIVHCKTKKQAEYVKYCIGKQLMLWKLELHPEKTRIVYCRDDNRTEEYPEGKFDFLGYTFRARQLKSKQGKCFIGFSPAVSNEAMKAMKHEIRHRKIHLRGDKDLEDLALMINPAMQGWINYYGKFHKSALYPIFVDLNKILVRWAIRKYKKFRDYRRKAICWLREIGKRAPSMFAHWRLLSI